MSDPTDQQLLQLIAEGESERVEFKESLAGDAPRRIREAICAFANDLPDTQQPGCVIVGVDDRGNPTGLAVDDEMLRRLADMKTSGHILPPPSMTVAGRELKGKKVAVITVQVSDSPPVRCEGRIYIRIGPRRAAATAQDERILNDKRRYGDRPYDLKPVSDTGLPDLNLALFEHEYLPQAFAPEVLAANQRGLEEKLVAAKMIESVDQPLSTVLGLLVLGKDIKFLIPGAYIQFLRIEGKDWAGRVIDEAVIRDNIGSQIQELDYLLRAHNRKIVEFVGIPREKQTYLYPPAALEQITRNAVLHRTYEGTNSPVYVRWFDNRIEVTSPGGPVGSVTPENFGNPGLTEYRNPNLADAMKTLQLVQRFGQGFYIANKELERAGNPPLSFKVDNSSVTVVIKPNPNFATDTYLAPTENSLFQNGHLRENVLKPHEKLMISKVEEIKIPSFADSSVAEIYSNNFQNSELTELKINEEAINIETHAHLIFFYIPFTGNRDLLLYKPSRFYRHSSFDAEIQGTDIVVKLITADLDDLTKLKKLFETHLDVIRQNIESINGDIKRHTISLKEIIITAIQKKQVGIKSAQSIAEELGFPLRRTSELE